MLSLAPADLLEEIRDAQKFMKDFADKRLEMIRRFAGNHYRVSPAAGDDNKTPENYPFSYVEFVKPQLIFGAPTAQVTPRRSVATQPIADAMQLAIEHWGKESEWKSTLSAVIDDAFFGFGVTKCGICQRGDYAGAGSPAVAGEFDLLPNWPFAIRISPGDFIIDFQSKSRKKVRYMGHAIERDLEDVKNDDTYDPDARAALNASVQGEPRTDQPFGRTRGRDRQRVRLWELYVPEHDKVITLAEQAGKETTMILAAHRYWGPDEGPYTIWGFNDVPDELIPLSPLQALWDEFLELNAHSRAAAKSASTHKRIGVYEPAAKEDAARIKKARSGDLVAVKNAKSIQNFELGGASEAQVSWVQFLRNRYDRNLGFTDAQRGQTANSTATEASIANTNSDLRTDKKRDAIGDCVVSVYRKIAWYFFNDPSIGRIETTRTDPVTGRQSDGLLIAGPWQGGYVANSFVPPEPYAEFTDFELTIQADTMGKQNDNIRQKRAQDELQLVMQMMQMGMPVNLRRALDRYGEAFNIKNYSAVLLLDQTGEVVPPDVLAGAGQGLPPGLMSAMQGGQQRPPPGMPQGIPPGMPTPGMPMRSPSTMPGLMTNAMAGVGASAL